MKILVLGKNGYVSRCFQGYMNDKDGYKVEAISVRGESLKKMSFAVYDVVFNTTGLAHNDARKGSDEEFVALNVTLTEELANKAKSDGVSLFIHMIDAIWIFSNSHQKKEMLSLVNTLYDVYSVYMMKQR